MTTSTHYYLSEDFLNAIGKQFMTNKPLSDEENDIVYSVYEQAIVSNYGLLKTSEAIKALGLNSQKELSHLIFANAIHTVKICGHVRIPSWSIFLYYCQKAFIKTENTTLLDLYDKLDNLDDFSEETEDFFDEVSFEMFEDAFHSEIEIWLSNAYNYYTLYDLMKILRLPTNIVFKILGSNCIKTFFHKGQLYCRPLEVHHFLRELEFNKTIIF